jgi:hypothetical protein
MTLHRVVCAFNTNTKVNSLVSGKNGLSQYKLRLA